MNPSCECSCTEKVLAVFPMYQNFMAFSISFFGEAASQFIPFPGQGAPQTILPCHQSFRLVLMVSQELWIRIRHVQKITFIPTWIIWHAQCFQLELYRKSIGSFFMYRHFMVSASPSIGRQPHSSSPSPANEPHKQYCLVIQVFAWFWWFRRSFSPGIHFKLRGKLSTKG